MRSLKPIERYEGSAIKPSAKNRRASSSKRGGLSPQEVKRRASKKKALETVYKEEVKEMFVNWFKKQNAVAGDVMSKRDVLQNIIKNLDKKQDEVLEAAMNELSTSGFMTTLEDGFSLMLTEKGAESL